MSGPLTAPLAEYIGADPTGIGPDFRFSGKDFQGSVGMYKFMAFAKRKLGRPVPALPYGCTLAEAEALLLGAPARTAAPHAPGPAAADGTGTAATTAAAAPIDAPHRWDVSPRADAADAGAGIDIESVASMPEASDYRAHDFYRETFAPAEIAYCVLKPDPREHFCGLFCAKEALLKADPECAGLAPIDIEVGHRPDGRPYFKRAGTRGAPPFALSVSHSGGFAVAVAVARPAAATAATGPDHAPAPPAADPAPLLRRQRRVNFILGAGLALSWLALLALLAALAGLLHF